MGCRESEQDGNIKMRDPGNEVGRMEAAADRLTHRLLELLAKNAFFGHFGGFEAGSRPN